jgi:hypothetical protein
MQTGVAEAADLRWCSSRDIADLGIPSPVRQLLAGLLCDHA